MSLTLGVGELHKTEFPKYYFILTYYWTGIKPPCLKEKGEERESDGLKDITTLDNLNQIVDWPNILLSSKQSFV